jgi:hypothetical protein
VPPRGGRHGIQGVDAKSIVVVRFRRILLVAVRSAEGPLTEHITATQAQPQERVFMPHIGPSRRWFRTAQSGGYLPLAPGISTVRYPIPERIFDYVSTVRSATAGTCQNETSRFLGKGALGQLLIIGALSRSSKGK